MPNQASRGPAAGPPGRQLRVRHEARRLEGRAFTSDMSETLTVLGAVVPVFGITLTGLVLRKLDWLTEEADQSLLRVNINLLLPCLILDSALGNPALRQAGNLLLAPVVGFVTVAVGMALCLALGRWTGTRGAREARTFAVSTGLYNYGFIPLPLAMLMFDQATVGVLCVHNVGVEIAVWTLGVGILAGGLGRDWRKFLNAPLLAIGLALLCNATGLTPLLPKMLLTALHWLAQCAIPLSLILAGAMVTDHLHEFHSAHGWRVIAASLALRVGVLPVLFLLLARGLPAPVELKRVMVLQAAMTGALFPIVMARHYGGDPPTAIRVAISSSVAGLVTIPVWIHLGMRWLGL